MAAIVKGTIGVVITFTVKRDGTALDISTATTKQIKLKSPTGIVQTFAASFVGGGSGGQISYTTAAVGDLNEVGTWKASAYIVMTGWTGQTSFASFMVEESL